MGVHRQFPWALQSCKIEVEVNSLARSPQSLQWAAFENGTDEPSFHAEEEKAAVVAVVALRSKDAEANAITNVGLSLVTRAVPLRGYLSSACTSPRACVCVCHLFRVYVSAVCCVSLLYGGHLLTVSRIGWNRGSPPSFPHSSFSSISSSSS